MQLTNISLTDNVVIILDRFLTIFVVIDSLSSVAFNNSFAKNLDGLNSNLTLTGSLLDGLKVLDRVFGTATLDEGSKIEKDEWDNFVVEKFSRNSPRYLALREGKDSTSRQKQWVHRTYQS